MFGNSITYGGAWCSLPLREDILNWGHPGQTMRQLYCNIKDILKQHPGTGIGFIAGGIHDITLGVSIRRITRNQQGVWGFSLLCICWLSLDGGPVDCSADE